MQNRGQIAIFVIIAIVLIGAISLFFVLHKNTSVKETSDPETNKIYNEISGCIKQTTEEGLNGLGLQGGYYIISTESENLGEPRVNVPYYILQSNNLVPSKKDIEQQLNLYLDYYTENCVYEVNSVKTQVNFSGNIDFESKIYPEYVEIKGKYPLTIKQENSTKTLSEFNLKIETPIYLLYEIALNYSNLYTESEGISLTYASEVDDNYNVTSKFNHYPDYTFVTLKKQINENKDIEWRFILG